MAYTTNQAIVTINEYLGIDESEKEFIENTKERGFVLNLSPGEKTVIFVYPLVHKQDNTKNYFDTRDSGAYERGVAWNYAINHKLKYFCIGVNDSVDKYKDYAFSLECSEQVAEKISGTENGSRNGPGNQIIIPNDYIPEKPFERIVNKLGIYIAAVHRSKLMEYLKTYDNRPYMVDAETVDLGGLEREEADAQTEDENDSVLNHNLFGIHIKEKNDALSDARPHICIGWSALGDLSDIDSKEKLSELYEQYFQKNNRGRGQDIGQIWRFLNDVKIGDYVIYADDSVFHIGRIESDYYYNVSNNPAQSADYTNNRKVVWLKKNLNRSMLSANLHNSLKTAMSIWSLNDYRAAVLDLLNGTYKKDETADIDESDIKLNFRTGLVSNYERNRIVFGAPGTGKSYKLKCDCENYIESSMGDYERVTFHPDYTYSQFVGAYKPVTDNDGKIRYDFVPGPFMRVYVSALKSGRDFNPRPYLLLIEEINRAKVAAVFGDVFQLLDRDEYGVSEYEIQTSEDIKKYLAQELGGNPSDYGRIRIPDNMFIWATMNSADQGVFPMDTAFKRRWNFEYLGINANEDKVSGRIMLGTDVRQDVEWNTLRKAINEKLAKEYKVNEDKLMGPFFLSGKSLITVSDADNTIADTDRFMEVFKNKVIMYLYEDAAKQYKHKLFSGCEDTTRYSSVCETFDRIGTQIFGEDFEEAYYNPQKG